MLIRYDFPALVRKQESGILRKGWVGDSHDADVQLALFCLTICFA